MQTTQETVGKNQTGTTIKQNRIGGTSDDYDTTHDISRINERLVIGHYEDKNQAYYHREKEQQCTWKQSLRQVLQVPDARQQQTTATGSTSLPTTRPWSIHTCLSLRLCTRYTTSALHTSQLYTVTNRQIPVYGIKYVPYQKDKFKIMIPYYVCDAKYPIRSASRLLHRGYNLKLDTRHCSLSHGDNTAPLLRRRGLFYLAIKRIYIPKGHKLQALMDHDGVMRAVIQPIATDNHLPQHNTIAPLTHTDQGLRRILGKNTDYWQLDGGYAIRVHKRPRKALFTPEDSGCPIPTEQLDDCRQTTAVRTGKELEILQDCLKQISKTELHKRLPSDDWVGETRFRRKMNPKQRITGKTTIARQSSSAQPEKQTTTTTRTSLTMRTPQNLPQA